MHINSCSSAEGPRTPFIEPNILQQCAGASGGCSSCGFSACPLKIFPIPNCYNGEETQLSFEIVFKRKGCHSVGRKQMSVKSRLLPSVTGERLGGQVFERMLPHIPILFNFYFLINYGREVFCLLVENFFSG